MEFRKFERGVVGAFSFMGDFEGGGGVVDGVS